MINEPAVQTLKEKISALEVAEAYCASPSGKFEIQKELEGAHASLSELMQDGLVHGELGLNAVDGALLRSYFADCVAFNPSFFQPHAAGNEEAISQFLIARGLAFSSAKGGLALTPEGILFCARPEYISSRRFHVHVQLQWGDDTADPREKIWGSVLYLHQQLKERTKRLTERTAGVRDIRDPTGSEMPVYEYPPIAIVEALTNFLIHRDYGLDDHGRLYIHADRIEFVNPGVSLTAVEDLLNSTEDLEPNYCRNSRIIEVMNEAGYNQKKGSGIRVIREALEANGTKLDDGNIGLKLWNDEEKKRFHLTIYRRDLSRLTEKKRSPRPGDSATRDEFRADISRIIKYAPAELIGREAETKLLSDAWDQAVRRDAKRPHVLTFVALGGEGKTSLVAKWAADLAFQDWPGCDAAFAWSFYSQGTREQLAASSDLFLKEALTFFGDDADREFAASSAGAFEKGQRLARIVAQRRSLLILDGLEPLQYSPTSPTPGELKDQGIAALLRALAAASHGLCVVTSRYSIRDLKAFWQTTAPDVKLPRLSRAAGVHLLKSMGVKGSERRNLPLKDSDEKSERVNEFEKSVEDVKGHALTLTLLGGFLKRAFHGDIRQRDRVKLDKADAQMDGGHAFRTMAAYEQWLLRDGGDEGRREVAVLRLMGLFDRPAAAGCLAALRSETIPGLTEPLAGLADDDWEYCLSGLEAAKLLTVNRDASGALVSLDAHPHLREYFARQLRTQQPEAWRAAHRRLYEHLCATTMEGDRPKLEDLQPLYQAVAHGCQAELDQDACDRVYYRRILRGPEAYSTFKLGAFASDLGAVACFFDRPWVDVSPAFPDEAQAWLLSEAAFRLRALGRLFEAIEPMRIGLIKRDSEEDWQSAAIVAGNLSELELTLGEVAGAVGDAEQAVTYADRSGDAFARRAMRGTLADALQQAGRTADAQARFHEAEAQQAGSQPDYPLLYSLQGFRYCELLLSEAELGAWQQFCNSAPGREANLITACRRIAERASHTLSIAKRNNLPLLDIALDHLTLGRVALYASILGGRTDERETATHEGVRSSEVSTDELASAHANLDEAVSGLRRAGTQDLLPRGLLSRAWLRFLTGARTGAESAQADLDEAWEIAERGPMRLFMADIHLYRARLFHAVKPYPWGADADGNAREANDDLAAARKLIEQCGYWRRKEELEDAEAAAKTW